MGMNSLYTRNQTDGASIQTCTFQSLFFVWASGLWKQIDCCCCCWQTRLHSPCSSWESTKGVMWHPSSGWQKMPGTAEAFSSVTLQPTTSPCSFPCLYICVSAHTLIISHVHPSFWTAANCFLPLWAILVSHIGMLFLWYQHQWCPDLLVCWCINHSSTQWKLVLCQTGVTWII